MVIVADKKHDRRPLKVERAYRELKRLIVTLRLPPGSPIDERELMERLEIGRTPLREAMLRLAHERLITRTPRRGAWVSELSIIDLQQMIEARSFVEPLVTRMAAERMTPHQYQELNAVLMEAHEAFAQDNLEIAMNLDLHFHSRIAKISGNEYFASFSHEVNTAMLRYWHVSLRLGGGEVIWLPRHREILEAVAAHDQDRAEAHAREHIEVFRQRLRGVVI